MNVKTTRTSRQQNVERIVRMILKSIPLAMGIAVVVTSLLGELFAVHGSVMLGIGMASVGLYLLKDKE